MTHYITFQFNYVYYSITSWEETINSETGKGPAGGLALKPRATIEAASQPQEQQGNAWKMGFSSPRSDPCAVGPQGCLLAHTEVDGTSVHCLFVHMCASAEVKNQE